MSSAFKHRCGAQALLLALVYANAKVTPVIYVQLLVHAYIQRLSVMSILTLRETEYEILATTENL